MAKIVGSTVYVGVKKIVEMIDDFKMNQEILAWKKAYNKVFSYRLNTWKDFMVEELGISQVEDVKPLHIKRYIQERQCVGKSNNSTINNNLATIKVFFHYLVDYEFIDEQDNPMRCIKSLKEEKTVIVTFNDDEVSRIIYSMKEKTSR